MLGKKSELIYIKSKESNLKNYNLDGYSKWKNLVRKSLNINYDEKIKKKFICARSIRLKQFIPYRKHSEVRLATPIP